MGLSALCTAAASSEKLFAFFTIWAGVCKTELLALHLLHAFWLHIRQLQHFFVILYPADPGEARGASYLQTQAVTLKGDWRKLCNYESVRHSQLLLLSSNLFLPWPSVKHFFISLFLLTRPNGRANTVPWLPLFVSFSFFTHFDYLTHIPQVSTLENSHQVWSCMPDKWERTHWREKPQPSLICYLIHLSI